MKPITMLARLGAVLAMVLGAVPAAIAADEIVIGASLPLSGPLAGFGLYQRWGYQTAVNEVNKAGGILVDGKKQLVKLVVRDDKTDPNATAANTESLISRDGAIAMLGSSTPGLVNAGALVAERRKIPLVACASPLQSFRAVRKWQYAWAVFFDEADLSSAGFRMLADYGLQTNKKVAILADNGPDGQVIGGKNWPEMAKAGGYTVVQNTSFPTESQQFTSMVAQAKSSDADVVLVMAVPPQAIAMRKQMAAAGFTPKVLIMEKGAEPEFFAQATGKLSEGVLVGGYWDPSFPYPGAADLAERFKSETKQSHSQHIADGYAVAQVLLDAIAAAGSTDRDKINVAIGKTDKSYVVGPIKFSADHTSVIPMTMTQWQNGKAVVVWPKDRATGKLIFPLPAAN